jgi:hypothetical protein
MNMKWKSRSHPFDVPDGTIVTLTRFLFLPKNIAGKTRWLCNATWTCKVSHAPAQSPLDESYLHNIAWVDQTPQKQVIA